MHTLQNICIMITQFNHYTKRYFRPNNYFIVKGLLSEFPFWFLLFFKLFFVYSIIHYLGWELKNRTSALKRVFSASTLVVKPDFCLWHMPAREKNSISWQCRVIFASYSIVSRKYILGNCPATITAYFSDIHIIAETRIGPELLPSAYMLWFIMA